MDHRAGADVVEAAVFGGLSDDQRAAILDAFAAGARAAGAMIITRDDLCGGDLPIVIDGATIGGLRLMGLQGALDRLVAQIEREIGEPVERLDREGKQAVVHRLDQLGAFTLRKAVEDIADRLQVSRFTVYNYLNSQA